MNRSLPSHMQHTVVQPRLRHIAMLLGVPLVVTLTMDPCAFADEPPLRSEEQVAEHAKAVWESGAINPAIGRGVGSLLDFALLQSMGLMQSSKIDLSA